MKYLNKILLFLIFIVTSFNNNFINAFPIYLRSLTGKLVKIDVNNNATTNDVKNLVAKIIGENVEKIKIISHGRTFEDDRQISYYGLKDYSSMTKEDIIKDINTVFVIIPKPKV